MRRLVAALLVLVSASLLAPGLAAAAPPMGCPTAMPTSEIKAEAGDADGFPATGWTVSRGTVPEEFDVQVLGVLEGGVAPGVDMIIVTTDSAALDAAGGIWAGMSGSPVHTDDGRLVGAVAYGLSGGPSKIGGLAAAEDMVRLLDLPLAESQLRAGVRLPAGLQRKTDAPDGARMDRLRLPVGVSGLQAGRLDAFASRLGLETASAHTADAADPVPGDPSEIVPGGNFAAALSYGYLSAAGVGTTTFVCDERTVAFGHPMVFSGPSGLSVHTADAIVIQDDPTFVPFKVANLGGVVGTLDQDRLSGVRGLLGDAPVPVVVRSAVNGTEQRETWVNRTRDVPDIAAFHLLGDIDGTVDRIGGGTAEVGWTVTGDAGTEQFSMTRTNRYADPFDVSFASIFELADQLFALSENRFSEVTFDTLRLTATAGSTFREYRIEGLEQRVAGEWVPVEADVPLEVEPGTSLRLRVVLSAYREPAPAPVELNFAIPDDAAGLEAFLSVAGGGAGEEEGPDPSSFEELVAALEGVPRNDEIVAELGFGGEPLASLRRRVAQVVTGSLGMTVIVTGGQPGPEPEPEPEPGPGPEAKSPPGLQPLGPEPPPVGGGQPPTLDLSGASNMRLGRALSRGIRLTVRSGEPGVLRLDASVNRRAARRLDLGKRVVGQLVRQIDAGETRVRLMLSRGARRQLRHAEKVTLALRTTLTGAAGSRQTSTSVVLRRMKS